ncbi:MAG TPA: isoprenylcysteine carboxylmethyltransferase family protein [Vicinamibacterales bacterium]|nr:isoprenylcysteine carboxylmethyltransferase family protein [Vicinamibacterales bacterium]
MTAGALRSAALWTRGLVFTALVPLVIGGWVPAVVDPFRRAAGGAWNAGWLFVACGAAIYAACLTRFVASGGTPAIFFTRPVRAVIGEEPHQLVQNRLYALSRNPMYVGVLLAVFGQAMVFASRTIAEYGAFLWLTFHLVVIALEEPHLRDRYGAAYEGYCGRVPRWLGLPRRW